MMKNIWLAIKGYFRRLDKVLLLLCLVAVSFSCLILYSELRAGFISTGSRRFNPFTMQVIAAVIGVVALLVMSVINYRFMAKIWFIHLPITLGLAADSGAFSSAVGAVKIFLYPHLCPASVQSARGTEQTEEFAVFVPSRSGSLSAHLHSGGYGLGAGVLFHLPMYDFCGGYFL